jgi:hypothetical protein
VIGTAARGNGPIIQVGVARRRPGVARVVSPAGKDRSMTLIGVSAGGNDDCRSIDRTRPNSTSAKELTCE